MRKIKTCVNQKDRVVCVSVPGSHEFYYQPSGSKERTLLFTTDFSGSVFAYFRDAGRSKGERDFSLTIKELYEFKRYYNIKLTTVIERIPSAIDCVLRNRIREREEAKSIPTSLRKMSGYDHRETKELIA